MARAKEFDTRKALATAMKVFWERGYENTSLEILLAEMGIAKQSLYDTFGDKRTLYMKALNYYREETQAEMRKTFESAPTVKDGFSRILRSIVAQSKEQHARGCLLLSANMERASNDVEIAELLQRNHSEVEAIFAEALHRAKDNGELSADQEPLAMARFFIATVQGMRALARLRSDRRALKQIASIALSAFNTI